MGLGQQERPLLASPATLGGAADPSSSCGAVAGWRVPGRCLRCMRSPHAPCHQRGSLVSPAATGPLSQDELGAGAAAASSEGQKPCEAPRGLSLPWSIRSGHGVLHRGHGVRAGLCCTTAWPGPAPGGPWRRDHPWRPSRCPRPGPTSPVASLCRSGPCWMPMGAASTRRCPTHQWAPRSPRRGCPGRPTVESHFRRFITGMQVRERRPLVPYPAPRMSLPLKLGSPRRIPVQPVDWKGYPRKPGEMSIKHIWWSQLPLWTTGAPPLGSHVGQCSTWAPDLFHLKAKELGLLHQLLAVPGPRASLGQREPLAKRPSWWQLEVVPGTLKMGLTGQWASLALWVHFSHDFYHKLLGGRLKPRSLLVHTGPDPPLPHLLPQLLPLYCQILRVPALPTSFCLLRCPSSFAPLGLYLVPSVWNPLPPANLFHIISIWLPNLNSDVSSLERPLRHPF